jgi:PAS domain S-box-containing protein
MLRAERRLTENSAAPQTPADRIDGAAVRPTAEPSHKLQDSALLAAIVESSDDAIIGKTLDGIITSWNNGARRIFGYTADEAIGQHISILIPPGRENEEPQIQERLRLGERVDHFDTVRVTKSGECVDVSLTISPIRDAGGQIVGASKISRDISERKRAEEQARRRDAELAHLWRVGAMGNIAAGLAHELNQPLAAIMNYAGVCVNLAKTAPLPQEKLLLALNGVIGETQRAGAIISRLRSFVAKQAPRSAAVDLNELVRRSIALLDFELRHAELAVQLQLATDLQPALADGVQIQQVLVNLLSNALQAMDHLPASERNLMVQTRRVDDKFAEIAVIDSGKGLAPEQLPHLFEPFFTTKPQGLGMGLNISRSIIERHGGRLCAGVNPTDGMRFSLTLPQVCEKVP